MALNYEAIVEDLRTVLSTVSGVKKIFVEAANHDITLDNMPLFNIRMVQAEEEIVNIPNTYYEFINIEVDVVAYDLTNFKEASIIRNGLLKLAKEAVRSNRVFNSQLETSRTAPTTRFGALSPEGAGGHAAVATFTVRCEAYVE